MKVKESNGTDHVYHNKDIRSDSGLLYLIDTATKKPRFFCLIHKKFEQLFDLDITTISGIDADVVMNKVARQLRMILQSEKNGLRTYYRNPCQAKK